MSRRNRMDKLRATTQRKAQTTARTNIPFDAPLLKYEGRTYPSGHQIDPNLPSAYGLPPEGKKSQRCYNCKFYTSDNHCALWDARARDEYWCAKWQPTQYITSHKKLSHMIQPGDHVQDIDPG